MNIERRRGHFDDAELGEKIFPELFTTIQSIFPKKDADDAKEVAATLDSLVEEFRADGEIFADTLLESVADEEFRAALEEAIGAASFFADRAGIKFPDAADFFETKNLVEKSNDLFQKNHELVPVFAPHFVNAKHWEDFIGEVSGGKISLLMAREADPLLQTEPADAGEQLVFLKDSPVYWSFRLIPAAETPAVMGFKHSYLTHVTLPEMLMLDAMSIRRGAEPVDKKTFTWIAGTINDGMLAARHIYDAGEHAIRVNCREVTNQGPHLGARPPWYVANSK